MWTETLKNVVRQITVEPVLLVFMLGSYMEYGVYQDLLYKKICLEHYDHNEVLCDNLTGDALDYVQTQGSYWLQYNNIALLVPSIVVACFLGSWSDLYGRKMPMITCCFSTLLGYLVFIIISVYEDSSVAYTLLANFVSGLGGGYLMLVASVMSYMADITTKEMRTSRVAVLESMTFLGSTLGPFISGYLLDGTSYAYTFLFCVACNTLVIIYIVMRIRNRPSSEGKLSHTKASFSTSDLLNSNTNIKVNRDCRMTYVYDGIVACFKQREGKKRLFIIFLMVSCICVFFASDAESDLTYLYVKDQPLSWSYKRYTQYSTLKSGLGGLMLLLGLPVIRHFLKPKDTSVAFLGLVSRVAGLLLLAFSTTDVMMFLVPVAALFSAYPIPCFRAMLSKLVENGEQGKLFSAISTIENLCTVIASIVFNNLYPATRSFLHGFCFLVAMDLLIIPVILICWMHFYQRIHRQECEEVQESEAV